MTLLDAATLVWTLSVLALLVLGPIQRPWAKAVRISLRIVGLVAGIGFLAKVYTVFEPIVTAGGM